MTLPIGPNDLNHLDALDAQCEPENDRAEDGNDDPPDDVVGQTADRTDLRNAELLVQHFGQDLRYVATWGKGLAWDGKRWALDEEARWQRAAANTVRILFDDACTELRAAGDDKDKAQAARVKISWAAKSHGAARLAAMIALAKSFPSIVIRHAALDSDPFLFNCANGTLDLISGELREHRRGDLITKLSPVVYDSAAKAPLWEAFLETVIPDAAVRLFVQRFAGSCLTGDVSDRVFVFLYGTGRNGKSVFLRSLRTLLGDYGSVAAPELLLAKRHDAAHPTELADLQGRRLVVCQEVPKGRAFDEQRIKELTGNEGALKARRMGEDFWEFTPHFKLAIAGNHEPSVRDDTDSIWDRLRKVPFTVRIADEKIDKHLFEKLRAEFPGMLAWAVHGCLDWREHGLPAPLAVTEASAAYRADEDVLGRFLTDRCVLHPDARATTKSLTDALSEWSKSNGEREVTRKVLASRLKTEGCSERRTNSARGWLGVRLLDPLEIRERESGSDGVTSGDAKSPLLAKLDPHVGNTPPELSPPVTRHDDDQESLADYMAREGIQ